MVPTSLYPNLTQKRLPSSRRRRRQTEHPAPRRARRPVSDRRGRGRTKSAASKGSRTRNGALATGRPSLWRRAARDGGAPELRRCGVHERPMPRRRLDFGEPEPKRPARTACAWATSCGTRGPRRATSASGCACGSRSMEMARGTIAGTIASAAASPRRELAPGPLRAPSGDARPPRGRPRSGPRGRARDDILEAGVRAGGGMTHVIDAPRATHLAATPSAQTCRLPRRGDPTRGPHADVHRALEGAVIGRERKAPLHSSCVSCLRGRRLRAEHAES